MESPSVLRGTNCWSQGSQGYPVHGRAFVASQGLSAAPLPSAAVPCRDYRGAAHSLSLLAPFPRAAAQEFRYSRRDRCRQHRRFPPALITAGFSPSGTLLWLFLVGAGTRGTAGASSPFPPVQQRAVRPRTDTAWHSFPGHRAWCPWEPVPMPDLVPVVLHQPHVLLAHPTVVPPVHPTLVPLHILIWSPCTPTLNTPLWSPCTSHSGHFGHCPSSLRAATPRITPRGCFTAAQSMMSMPVYDGCLWKDHLGNSSEGDFFFVVFNPGKTVWM